MVGSTTQAIKSYWLREQGVLSAYDPESRTAKRLKGLPPETCVLHF
ncbi:MAG: hypothetical protein R3C11_13475 [Planctomycetaceae bacterium]